MEILQGKYRDLAVHLTKDTQSELEKVRVLFRWLTSLDLHALVYRTGNDLPEPGTPLEGLLEIHWSMSNHAHFFARVAR